MNLIRTTGHANNVVQAVSEYLSFDAAFHVALEYAKSRNDTVVIAAPDHDTGGLNLPNADGVVDSVDWTKYADARAKSNRIFFNAWLSSQTNGYSYGELVDIANNAIWQYRDMYLRPDFYANNLEKIRAIIAPVIEDYKYGKISYAEAEFNARTRIY